MMVPAPLALACGVQPSCVHNLPQGRREPVTLLLQGALPASAGAVLEAREGGGFGEGNGISGHSWLLGMGRDRQPGCLPVPR